jgi:hypothetical protein
MPQETNLNVSPYFSDFDPAKNYYKVLFKPGFPIQSRELTNLQSIQQDQIEKFGNYFFKEGSIVIPGQLNYNRTFYSVSVQDEFLGIPIEDYIDGLVNLNVVGSDTGVKAKIVHVLKKGQDSNNSHVIFVSYTAAGTNNEQVFNDNEILSVDSNFSYNNITFRTGDGFATTNILNSTNTGSAVILSEGVYYLRGTFVNVNSQVLVLDAFNNNPSYRVGFDIIESVVSSFEDDSLADNSQGFNNYAAPGADRFKIEAILTKKEFGDINAQNFVELMSVKNGDPISVIDRPGYNSIKDELARRTYEESGNYYVKPFEVVSKETLNDYKTSFGIFNENQLTYNNNVPRESLGTYKISPGKAYVNGYETEFLSNSFLDFEKPRTTKTLTNQSINYTNGVTYTVNRVYGAPNIGISTSTIISLRNQRVGQTRNLEVGKEVGLARVYDFYLENGSYDIDNLDRNEWNLILYDVQPYTEILLNEPVTLTTPTQIKGSSSGAIGYLRFDASNSGILTAYNISGKFLIGESFEYNGISTSGISTNIIKYSSNSVKSVRGIVGAANTFTADLSLRSSVFIGPAQVTEGLSGISTVTITEGKFLGNVENGDIVAYSRAGFSTVSFAKIDSFTEKTLVISGIATVSDICDGALPNSTINPSDFTILKPLFKNSSNTEKLYNVLPKRFVSNVNLDEANLNIRRQFNVSISGNQTNVVSAAENQTFLPFDAERYILVRSDGSLEALTEDKLFFTDGSTKLQINGLGLDDPNCKLIASLRKINVKSKLKVRNNIGSLLIDKSKYEYSGIGASTINDGLTYGLYPYGTRVQDKEICLNIPDIDFVYAIYESSSTSDPSAPSLVLTSLSGATSTTSDLILGEEFVGESSNAVSIFAERVNQLTISHVKLNTNTFQVGETIRFKQSGITAVIQTVNAGDVNIVKNFSLDAGYRDSYYDYSRIIRNSTSKEPTKKIKVFYRFGAYSSSDSGDITTVNSYSQYDYSDIPRTNVRITHSNILDFRPRVSNFTVSESTLSPFEFNSRDFSSSQWSSSNILSSGESVLVDFSYYLPRIDKIYLTKYGEFKLSKGEPSDDPKPPARIEDALEIATITLSPWMRNAVESDISLTTHKRYQMRDIYKLETRIKNLEYYTSLTMLESNTENLFIRDKDGFNRFKSGFFVDNFATTSNQLKITKVKNSIDPSQNQLRPSFYTNEIDLLLGSNSLVGVGTSSNPLVDTNFASDLVGNNIKKTGQLLTLDYTDVEEIIQPYATRVESVTPFLVTTYKGTIVLTPSSDTWVDTTRIQAKRVEVDNYQLELNQLAAQGFDTQNGFGQVVWNEWETTWTGRELIGTRSEGERLAHSTGNHAYDSSALIVEGTGMTAHSLMYASGIPFNMNSSATGIALDGVQWTNFYYPSSGPGGLGVHEGRIDTFETRLVDEFREVGASRRSGTITVLAGDQWDEVSNGDSVVSSDIVAFMRSRNIEFVGTRFKPLSNLYAFFDGVDVNRFIVPKLIEISMVSGTFNVGETVSGNMETESTVYHGISFRVASSNHKRGPYNNPTEVYTINPYASTIQIPENYSSTSSLLNVDTFSLSQQPQGDYYGYIKTGIRLRGQTSGAEAIVTNVRLVSDNTGSILGSFYIPDYQVIGDVPIFETGTKLFRLTSSTVNSNIAGMSDNAAEEQYTASGTLNTIQETIVATRTPRFETETVFEQREENRIVLEDTGRTQIRKEYHHVDPLAQTFLVGQKAGYYVTKVDIYLSAKDDTLPLTVQLRTVVNGTPTSKVYPFGEVVLNPDEVNISDDASVATTIVFPSPIYLRGGDEAALVLLSEGLGYKAWISRLGEIDISTIDNPETSQIVVSSQPDLGSLFKSQNGTTWNPSQYEDLKYTLYRANFVSSGYIDFFNPKLSEGNKQIPTLLNNSIEFNSRRVKVGLGKTIQDSGLVLGNTVSQIGSNAYGNYVGSAGSVFGNLTLTNPGIGYTPIAAQLSYSNVSLESLTGSGVNATANITILNGVAIAATIASGGSGYKVGDVLTVNQIGSETLGRNLKLSVSELRGINEITLDNVQGDFVVGSGATVQYINSSGVTTSLNGTSDVFTTYINNVSTQFDGSHVKVNHKNNGMHSSRNIVKISNVSSDVPFVTLSSEYAASSTDSIALSSVGIFTSFENVSVSSTNPGYIRIDNEIISYTGVSDLDSSLTGITRGIDQTNSYTYPTQTKVYKYENNGISLRRINKNHNLSTSNVTESIGLDHYYIKLDMSLNGVDRTTGIGFPKLYINETKSSGGSQITASQNIPFEVLRPIVQTLTFPNTELSASIRTVSGTSVDGNEVSFVDQGFETINLNSNNYFNSTRIICSEVNEQNNLVGDFVGNKSFTMRALLTSTDPKVSPAIDLDRVGMIFTTNRVNSVITDFKNDPRTSSLIDDPSAFVYASKMIYLDAAATSIKIMTAAYIHTDSDIRAFYAISNDPQQEPVYYPFPGYGDPKVISGDIDFSDSDGTPDSYVPKTDAIGNTDFMGVKFREHEFTVNYLPSFRYFSIKLVGTSTNQAYPPRLKDLRVIALA